jgi:hypothetical protein
MQTFYFIFSLTDVLQNLKSALVAHKTAETELKEQMETIRAPEMQAKYEECREVEKQLKDLEKKLGNLFHVYDYNVVVFLRVCSIMISVQFRTENSPCG